MVYRTIWFVVQHAWWIWPTSIFADFAVSTVLIPRNSRFSAIRWLPRLTHSFAAGGVIGLVMVEHFWLYIVNIHYHGGAEKCLIGLLAVCLSIRLSLQFDKGIRQIGQRTQRLYYFLVWLLVGISAALTIVCAVSSTTPLLSINLGPSGETIAILGFVPLLLLAALACLTHIPPSKAQLIFCTSATAILIIGLLLCLLTSNFVLFGFSTLHSGHPDDDIWYILTTALLSFAIMLACALLRIYFRQRQPDPQGSKLNSGQEQRQTHRQK